MIEALNLLLSVEIGILSLLFQRSFRLISLYCIIVGSSYKSIVGHCEEGKLINVTCTLIRNSCTLAVNANDLVSAKLYE